MDEYYETDLGKWIDALGKQEKYIIPEEIAKLVLSFPTEVGERILYGAIYYAVNWEHKDNYLTLTEQMAVELLYKSIGVFGQKASDGDGKE